MGEITTMPTVEEKAPENILRESSSAENVEVGQNISGNPSSKSNPETSFEKLFQIEVEEKAPVGDFVLGDDSESGRVVVAGTNSEKIGFDSPEVEERVNDPHKGSHWIYERNKGLEV